MTENTDNQDEEGATTDDPQTRWEGLGTLLAIAVVPAPMAMAGYLLATTGDVPFWLQGIVGFEAVAGTIWWVGEGVGKKAAEVVSGLGGGG